MNLGLFYVIWFVFAVAAVPLDSAVSLRDNPMHVPPENPRGDSHQPVPPLNRRDSHAPVPPVSPRDQHAPVPPANPRRESHQPAPPVNTQDSHMAVSVDNSIKFGLVCAQLYNQFKYRDSSDRCMSSAKNVSASTSRATCSIDAVPACFAGQLQHRPRSPFAIPGVFNIFYLLLCLLGAWSFSLPV